MPFPKPSRPSTLAHSGPHISMRRGQTTVVLRCLPRLLEPISRPSVPYAMRVQYMDAAGCSGSWECKSCSGGEKKSLVHPVLRLLGGITQYWPVLTTSLAHQPLSSPPAVPPDCTLYHRATVARTSCSLDIMHLHLHLRGRRLGARITVVPW